MQNYRGQILEVDIEEILEMTTLEEVEVGLGTDNIQVILEEMTEVVVVGQDQTPELILTGSDTLSVGNMIILLKTVPIYKEKKNQNKYNNCIIWMKIKQH